MAYSYAEFKVKGSVSHSFEKHQGSTMDLRKKIEAKYGAVEMYRIEYSSHEPSWYKG